METKKNASQVEVETKGKCGPVQHGNHQGMRVKMTWKPEGYAQAELPSNENYQENARP